MGVLPSLLIVGEVDSAGIVERGLLLLLLIVLEDADADAAACSFSRCLAFAKPSSRRAFQSRGQIPLRRLSSINFILSGVIGTSLLRAEGGGVEGR